MSAWDSHVSKAMAREDSTSVLWYSCTVHMLWIEERTRQLDGGHIEFLRGVSNPLGLKASNRMDPTELVKS
ncbi:hypothetical protein SUGI_1006650 [Cryptomeria japonica]|nr:hypothetical protein SUGI_1006650 [Cryptomeria japonica]